MSVSSNQRAKLLHVMKILLDKSDEQNPMTIGEIIADVSVSPVFLAWMFQFGDRAEIKAPGVLIEAMRVLIEANARKYRSVPT